MKISTSLYIREFKVLSILPYFSTILTKETTLKDFLFASFGNGDRQKMGRPFIERLLHLKEQILSFENLTPLRR